MGWQSKRRGEQPIERYFRREQRDACGEREIARSRRGAREKFMKLFFSFHRDHEITAIRMLTLSLALRALSPCFLARVAVLWRHVVCKYVRWRLGTSQLSCRRRCFGRRSALAYLVVRSTNHVRHFGRLAGAAAPLCGLWVGSFPSLAHRRRSEYRPTPCL